ncbi:hypothetical protein DWW36_16960 [Erysipelotrichaceae bacterium AF15-26LB]|nr:polysaccharide biosynthesis C-terminal domain-containing protein [[Clostridium] innocuum]RJV84307.1 hypothetical protein DWW36_16960 [Erysipelotrichaceae bacterium AF15-26LB]RJV84983.1 hypothetical protein DWX45_17710 [Erysipelotrichaceae bacterium AF19-24AC]
MNMKKSKSSVKAVMMLFFLTIVTKIVGFLKTSITAASFGVSIETDIYNLADGVVNQIFSSFSAAIVVIILPIYLAQKHKNENEGRIFARSSYYSLALFSIFLVGILYFLNPYIVDIMGYSYNAEYKELFVNYLQILEIGISFSIITGALQAILNAEKIYGFPSICAMVNSFIVILLILLFKNTIGLWAIVIASPIAYIAQIIILRYKTNKYLSAKVNDISFDQNIKKLFTKMFPLFIGNATLEINSFIDKYFLSGIKGGVLSSVSYANTILVFATNIIMLPLSTVLFTDISTLRINGETDKIKKIVKNTLLGVIAISLPITLVFVICSEQIISILFGYGKFNETAIKLTSSALSIYGITIVFHIIKYVLNRVLYAFLDTKTPMKIGIFTVLIHIFLVTILAKKYGMQGILISNVLDVIISTTLTYLIISKNYFNLQLWKDFGILFSLLLAFSVSAISIITIKYFINVNVFINFILYSLTGLIVYLLIIIFFQRKFVFTMMNNLKNMRKKDN